MNDTKPFQCTECDLRFTTNAAKKIHTAKKHGKVNNFNCSLCGYRFSDPTKLRKHKLDRCKERAIHNITSCEYCGMNFSNSLLRSKHILTVHGKNEIPCCKCGYQPIDGKDLLHHSKSRNCVCSSNSESRPTKQSRMRSNLCTKCGIPCRDRMALDNHTKKHKVELIACAECDYIGTAQGLKRHMEWSYPNEHYKSQKLYSRFRDKYSGKPISCSECDFVGTNTLCIKDHMLQIHKNSIQNLVTKSASEDTLCSTNEPIKSVDCSNITYNHKDPLSHINTHTKTEAENGQYQLTNESHKEPYKLEVKSEDFTNEDTINYLEEVK
ncbi:unnamed protein product, partial [Meganyctiphanes norvegica]